MAIHVPSAASVRRQVLRRLPRRLRPLRRGAAGCLLAATVVGCALLGLRWSAPVGPLVPVGPLLGIGALERRPVELIAPDFLVYPERIAAEEGWLTVPGDHAFPDAASLRVHYTMLPQRLPQAGSEQASTRSEAADAAAPSPVPAAAQPQASPSTRQRAERMPATSPIVLLADPLHGSATHALVGPEFAALQQLRTLGPLLAFDGRDSALADPAPHCPGQWAHPSAEPLARESLRRSLRPLVQHCAEAFQHTFAGHRFDTAQSVADLEALREALGIERIRLLARGGGARLALAYMDQHPQRVERALLLAPQVPWRAAPRPQHVEGALQRALAALRSDPHWKLRLPEPRESLRVAIARLDVQPVQQPVRDPRTGKDATVVLGAADLRLAVLDRLGRRDGVQQLGALLEDVFRERYRSLASIALELRRQPPPLAASLANRCALQLQPAQARRERMTAAFTLLGDAADLVRLAHCQDWPASPAQPHWEPPAVAPPVLFVAGTFDPLAPLEQVEELAQSAPNWRVLRTTESAPLLHLVADGFDPGQHAPGATIAAGASGGIAPARQMERFLAGLLQEPAGAASTTVALSPATPAARLQD